MNITTIYSGDWVCCNTVNLGPDCLPLPLIQPPLRVERCRVTSGEVTNEYSCAISSLVYAHLTVQIYCE